MIQAVARNLGLILRHVFGTGSARGMQDIRGLALRLYSACLIVVARLGAVLRHERIQFSRTRHTIQSAVRRTWMFWFARIRSFSTGC
jgi:hypothetical protein